MNSQSARCKASRARVTLRPVYHQTRYETNSVLQIARIAGFADQQHALDCPPDAQLLRDDNHSWAGSLADELTQMIGDRADVMADQPSALLRCQRQNHRVIQSFERNLLGPLKVGYAVAPNNTQD